MTDGDPIAEPEGRVPRRRGRWLVIALAIVAALLASRLAPESWPDGAGRIQVTYLEQTVIDEAVTFDGAEISLGGAAGDATLSLAIADGLSSEQPIRGELFNEGGACGGESHPSRMNHSPSEEGF